MSPKPNVIRLLFLFIILSTFTFGCKQTSKPHITQQVSNQTLFDFNYQHKTKNYVSAHRGGSGIKNFPENCVETFDYLYRKGIQIFEIDVALTKDQQMVLMHDNSLQRTSTGRQDVNQVNLSQIKEYFLRDDFGQTTHYKIPTLTEALKWGKGKSIYFMIDIKKDVPYKELITEIKNQGMEKQVVLVTYSVKQAKKLHHLAPEMYLSVTMRNEREFNEMINSDIATDRMLAFTGTKRSPKTLLDKIHQKNIMVIFGTLGNIDKSAKARGNNIYQELEADGVDIFATDRALDVYETINQN